MWGRVELREGGRQWEGRVGAGELRWGVVNEKGRGNGLKDAPRHAQPYFGAVATISNVWRTSGMPVRVKSSCSALFGDEVVAQRCSKLPGRVLRGRWGSIDEVEAIIDKGSFALPRVFGRIFAKAPQTMEPKGVRRSEQDEYRKKIGKWKSSTVASLASSTFLATVRASLVAKSPLIGFPRWGQKQTRETNVAKREA